MFKKFEVNENFFKTWNEKSAYVLGWMISDGCMNYIPGKKYEIRFELTDLDAVETIRELMESTHEIRERHDKGNTQYGLFINNKKLIKQLLDIGVTPAKTNRLQFPQIPKEHMKHFIRGFFDGDGSVQVRPRHYGYQLTSYFGCVCKPFLEKLGEILRDETDNIPKIHEDTPGFYKLQYGGKESYALYRYMYQGAIHYLTRKKEKFEQGIEIKAGTGLADCKRCGKEIVRVSGRTKWCAECKKVVLREQWNAKHERKKTRQSQIV